MTRHPLEAEDLAAGRAAFAAGEDFSANPYLNARHGVEPSPIATLQRYEAWRAGWIAARRGEA